MYNEKIDQRKILKSGMVRPTLSICGIISIQYKSWFKWCNLSIHTDGSLVFMLYHSAYSFKRFDLNIECLILSFRLTVFNNFR